MFRNNILMKKKCNLKYYLYVCICFEASSLCIIYKALAFVIRDRGGAILMRGAIANTNCNAIGWTTQSKRLQLECQKGQQRKLSGSLLPFLCVLRTILEIRLRISTHFKTGDWTEIVLHILTSFYLPGDTDSNSWSKLLTLPIYSLKEVFTLLYLSKEFKMVQFLF